MKATSSSENSQNPAQKIEPLPDADSNGHAAMRQANDKKGIKQAATELAAGAVAGLVAKDSISKPLLQKFVVKGMEAMEKGNELGFSTLDKASPFSSVKDSLLSKASESLSSQSGKAFERLAEETLSLDDRDSFLKQAKAAAKDLSMRHSVESVMEPDLKPGARPRNPHPDHSF
ncbi:hypothetical protein [Chromobacterium phragmitis]|uniref:Uncharacterized protein n=1 Tax=Chromobacterium phragmitis TaxID=2202141 RepID=A0ABV0IMJ8_9NEIS|nr:hypothetical protein [Chromobacterium phragmitis]